MAITVSMDWNRDGDFSDFGDDVTADVHRDERVEVQYGRDQGTAMAPTVSGSGRFTLDNRTGKYSPRNTGSPLYGNLKPARPVRITRTVGVNTYTLFHGHTDDSPLSPDLQSRQVALTLIDWLADIRGQTISTGLHRGIRTGQAIGYILDACGWSATLRDLDPGGTTIPWWWEDNTDASTALDKVLRSEGMPALLTVGPSGEIVFRDRHHRLVRAASITSQGTWRATGTVEPVMQVPFTIDESWKNIVNAASVSVDVRHPQQLQPVWTSDTAINLTGGEETVVSAVASDPFYNAVAPELGTDYTLVSGSVTTRLITDSGLSVGIVLTAGASGAMLSSLQLRANPVSVTNTVRVSAEDATSITEYGRRGLPDDLPWCGVGDANALVSLAVSQRARPLPIASTRFVVGRNTAKANAILARDLSDRVTVVEPYTFTNGPFHIESIAHEFAGEHDHTVTIGTEAAPQPIADFFILGSATQGVLGTNRLAGRAMDDPAKVFILGSGTNGLLGTSILAT